jgi:hypothetical protein
MTALFTTGQQERLIHHSVADDVHRRHNATFAGAPVTTRNTRAAPQSDTPPCPCATCRPRGRARHSRCSFKRAGALIRAHISTLGSCYVYVCCICSAQHDCHVLPCHKIVALLRHWPQCPPPGAIMRYCTEVKHALTK